MTKKNDDAFRDEAMKSLGVTPPAHEAYVSDADDGVLLGCTCDWSHYFKSGARLALLTQTWAMHATDQQQQGPPRVLTQRIPPDGGPPHG